MRYKPTCLERDMEEILSSLGLDFEPQVPTRSGFVIDFAIYIERPNKKIAIETDGNNWHSSKKAKQKGRFRDLILKREGWTVIHFGEDFNCELVKSKIVPILERMSSQG